jgi:ribosome-associated protein
VEEALNDLTVRAGPGLPHGLTVPATELLERFSRSSGPGGQSVNTTDSRVEVVLDLATTTALTDEQRTRALERLGPVLSVTASEHRSQHRNRLAARQRLADRLREALAPPALPASRPSRRVGPSAVAPRARSGALRSSGYEGASTRADHRRPGPAQNPVRCVTPDAASRTALPLACAVSRSLSWNSVIR